MRVLHRYIKSFTDGGFTRCSASCRRATTWPLRCVAILCLCIPSGAPLNAPELETTAPSVCNDPESEISQTPIHYPLAKHYSFPPATIAQSSNLPSTPDYSQPHASTSRFQWSNAVCSTTAATHGSLPFTRSQERTEFLSRVSQSSPCVQGDRVSVSKMCVYIVTYRWSLCALISFN